MPQEHVTREQEPAPPARVDAAPSGAPTIARMSVGAADDRYEREAERVAREVVQRLGGSSTLHGRDGAFAAGGTLDGETSARIRRSMTGGRPLDGSTRSRLEGAMGADLGHVRVHEGSNAHGLATSIAAKAFTAGSHVFLGESASRELGTAKGDHLLAHEVTHVLQNDAGVHRVSLSPDEVVAAVTEIPFVKAKLDEKLRLSHKSDTAARNDAYGPVKDHVTAVIGQYKANLSGADGAHDEAMALAIVMDAVSKVLAFNVLNDPALAPSIAAEFMTVYAEELRQKLTDSDDQQRATEVERTLDVAKAIVADDPLGLYMHNELRLDHAARRIRMMASAASVPPAEMFTTLRQRFEVDMAARSKSTIAAAEDQSANYNVKHSTGELSEEWFVAIFGNKEKATWKDSKRGRTLDYSKDARRRLEALRKEVSKDAKRDKAPSDRAGLTWRQAKHLDEVDHADQQRNAVSDDANAGTQSVDSLVAAVLARDLGVKPAEADQMVAKVRQTISSLPITITVKGDDWFSSKMTTDRDKPNKKRKKKEADFDYRPGSARHATIEKSTLYGKKVPKVKGKKGGPDPNVVKHLGEFDPNRDPQNRGADYFRFRTWKDQTMTGNQGLADSELPVFGAVNPNLHSAYGSMGSSDADYGENSYGNLHFIIKKANLRGRVIYTATDHGEPHTDPFLAFADFLLAGKAESRTKLKDITTLKGTTIHVLNALILGDKAVAAALKTQNFEVQIFGKVNMIDDVAEIWYAPSISTTAKANLEWFETQFGVPVKAIADFTPLKVEGGATLGDRTGFGQRLAKAL